MSLRDEVYGSRTDECDLPVAEIDDMVDAVRAAGDPNRNGGELTYLAKRWRTTRLVLLALVNNPSLPPKALTLISENQGEAGRRARQELGRRRTGVDYRRIEGQQRRARML